MSSEHETQTRWFDLSPPRGGIAFIAVCFILGALIFIILGGDSWYTRWVAPFFLPVGIGLWLKHAWARWVAFAFFAITGVLLVLMTIQGGFVARRLVQGFIIAGSLVALWEWKVAADDAG